MGFGTGGVNAKKPRRSKTGRQRKDRQTWTSPVVVPEQVASQHNPHANPSPPRARVGSRKRKAEQKASGTSPGSQPVRKSRNAAYCKKYRLARKARKTATIAPSPMTDPLKHYRGGAKADPQQARQKSVRRLMDALPRNLTRWPSALAGLTEHAEARAAVNSAGILRRGEAAVLRGIIYCECVSRFSFCGIRNTLDPVFHI